MKWILLYLFTITLFLSCSANKEKIIELPNGEVVENFTIKDLLSIYPEMRYEQYNGFVFSDTTCTNMRYVVLTKFGCSDVLSQEDIEKEKDQEIKGFLAFIRDEKSTPESLVECMANLFDAKFEKLEKGWSIIKDHEVIGCLFPNSRDDGYVWILSRDKSIRELYSK